MPWLHSPFSEHGRSSAHILFLYFFVNKISLCKIPKFAVSRLLRWINLGKKLTVRVIFYLCRFFFSSLRTLEQENIIFCASKEMKWFHVDCSDWLIISTWLSKSELLVVLNCQLWIKHWASRKHLCFPRRSQEIYSALSFWWE